MTAFRINKSDNYTIMSNYHLRDKKLSLKAKGLLSFMLSLPDDWDYSLAGLISLCKEGRDGIKSILNELKESGYLEIIKVRDDKGRFTYDYSIYEKPITGEKEHSNLKENTPDTAFPPLESPATKNLTQINTNNKDKIDQISENLNNFKNDESKTNYLHADEFTKKHSPLTYELLDLGYLTNDDYLDSYDRLFNEFLTKGEKINRLRVEINYIVPRVIDNYFNDENGKPISNKYGYLKNAIQTNFKMMDKRNELSKTEDLFEDNVKEYDWLNDR